MSASLPSALIACALSLQQPADIAAYRHVIDAYRDGAVPPGEPAGSGEHGLSLVGRVVDPASGWTAADLAAAAMLHTDMALKLAKESSRPDAAAHVDAERHYLAALDAFPWGQSAPLALSHLLMRAGREAEARAAVARHVTRTGGRSVEPLWTYLADPATDLGPTLNRLRAEVRR